jgi:hypothetical protein
VLLLVQISLNLRLVPLEFAKVDPRLKHLVDFGGCSTSGLGDDEPADSADDDTGAA